MFVTICASVVCVVVYLLQIIGVVGYADFGLIPNLVQQGQAYRLLTSAFLHGSIQHIASNLLSFINLGTYCEIQSSRKKYLLVLLLSLIGSATCIQLLSASDRITIGFSGVVFGVLGYFATILFKNDNRFDSSELYILGRMIIPNIIISLMPGVSWQGHLGGFIGGVIAGIFIRE